MAQLRSASKVGPFSGSRGRCLCLGHINRLFVQIRTVLSGLQCSAMQQALLGRKALGPAL